MCNVKAVGLSKSVFGAASGLLGMAGLAAAVALAAMGFLWVEPAGAFDTGPHFDLTRDALTAEGFSETALQVAQVNNWMVDFYEQASQNPYSGHSAWWKELIGGAIGYREHWSDTVVNSADWLHFDSTPRYVLNNLQRGLDSAEIISMEWERFAKATRAAAVECAASNDIQGLLTVIGITTHAVQDFYAHSNWVEPAGNLQSTGYDGPGWAQKGIYGTHPTWFDIPDDVRRAARVYSGVGGDLRGHGAWNSDGNRSLRTAVNKDWPGRPLYRDAYVTAYFATRQWVRAIRSWVNNQAVWRAAQQYGDRKGNQLSRDVNGAFKISFDAGHWQGQGEPAGAEAPGPGGSLDDLIVSIGHYHRAGKTAFRSKFEQIVPKIASKNPAPGNVAVASSRDIQSGCEFVSVKVTRVKHATPATMVGIDAGLDKADFYSRAIIAGQGFCSGMIHGYDTFDFRLPNYPFTFVKAIPKTRSVPEPITTLRVTVRTCDVMWAGTDDDVFLRVNDSTRFKLDKPLYNDFERGDEDTYSIDPPAGMTVSDLKYIQIEKSRDGVAGGWKLSRVALEVNGNRVYYKDKIDKWLEKSNLTWRAPDFKPTAPITNEVPITIQLWDSDGFLYGDDDHCDIHPDYGRRDLNLLYDKRTSRVRGDLSGNGELSVTGGSSHGGRGRDDDTCQISLLIETYTVKPPSSAATGSTPTSQPAKEDLIHFDYRKVEAKEVGGKWKVTAGNTILLDFGSDEAAARKAVSIIKHYRMNAQGFVGRPNPSMQYYLVDGAAPSGPFPGEDCLPFNPSGLRVQQVGGAWKIVEGSHYLLDFGASESEARAALDIIRKYGFTSVCYVSRPNPPMMYFRN